MTPQPLPVSWGLCRSPFSRGRRAFPFLMRLDVRETEPEVRHVDREGRPLKNAILPRPFSRLTKDVVRQPASPDIKDRIGGGSVRISDV